MRLHLYSRPIQAQHSTWTGQMTFRPLYVSAGLLKHVCVYLFACLHVRWPTQGSACLRIPACFPSSQIQSYSHCAVIQSLCTQKKGDQYKRPCAPIRTLLAAWVGGWVCVRVRACVCVCVCVFAYRYLAPLQRGCSHQHPSLHE